MNPLFHPVSEQAALASLAELPRRLAANACRPRSYRGTEGPLLLAQARLQQRWYQLFDHLNRRICP